VAPAVVLLATTFKQVTEQVRLPPVAEALGAAMFCVTVAVAVLVQPLAGLVTVTV
jgi:hypothetical protein